MSENPMIHPMKTVWLFASRELRAQRNAFLGWLVPLAGLMAAVAGMQPEVAGKGGLMAAKLAAMPENLKQAFGVGLVDFSRPAGYLATNFLLVTLGASLFAAILGASVVSREDVQRTTEAMLTLPVSRWQMLLGKALAGVSLVVTFHAVLLATTLAVFAAVHAAGVEVAPITAMFAGAAALGLLFFGAGFMLATMLTDSRPAPTMALGLVLLTYFFGVTARLSPKAEVLGLLAPYGAVDPSRIAEDGGLAPKAVWLLVLGVSFLLAALVRYQRKDVHA